jgi:serine/threonine protein kinase
MPGKKKYAYTRYIGSSAAKAHLIVQPSPYAQKLRDIMKSRFSKDFFEGRAEYARGRDLWELRKKMPPMRTREKIVEQFADALVEQMRLGVMHGDIRSSNIIVSGQKRPKLKVIDYETAFPLTSEELDRLKPKKKGDIGFSGFARDYVDAMTTVSFLAKNQGEEKKLKELFRKTFLKRIEEKL